jgi:hypothetical protein
MAPSEWPFRPGRCPPERGPCRTNPPLPARPRRGTGSGHRLDLDLRAAVSGEPLMRALSTAPSGEELLWSRPRNPCADFPAPGPRSRWPMMHSVEPPPMSTTRCGVRIQGQAVGDAQVDQSGFFPTRHDLDLEAQGVHAPGRGSRERSWPPAGRRCLLPARAPFRHALQAFAEAGKAGQGALLGAGIQLCSHSGPLAARRTWTP